MQYTEQDLQNLVAAVEKEFAVHLAKAESTEGQVETLAKAEEGEKKPDEKPEAKEGDKKPEGEEKKPEGHEEKKPEAEAAPAKPEGEQKPEGEAPAAEAPAAEAPAAAQGDEACDYDAEDLEHMQKMYMSMSKGELKAHHDSCRRALDEKGLAKCGDMSMNKSETAVASVEVKPEIVEPKLNELELTKSELEAQKAKTETLQKSLDAVSALLTKMVEKRVAPAGKAITSLDVIAKSEGAQEEKTLSKGEIDTILNKKSQDPKLEKSDREAINAYYLNSGSLNSISHLLK